MGAPVDGQFVDRLAHEDRIIHVPKLHYPSGRFGWILLRPALVLKSIAAILAETIARNRHRREDTPAFFAMQSGSLTRMAVIVRLIGDVFEDRPLFLPSRFIAA